MYKNGSVYPKLRSNLFFSHVWHLESHNISLWPQKMYWYILEKLDIALFKELFFQITAARLKSKLLFQK